MKKVLILTFSVMILAGCFQGGVSESGPEETLREFYRNLFSGDFNSAESLCDTLEMRGYVENLRNAWNVTDSAVTKIMPAILSEMEISVTEVVKKGKEKTVFYELTATDGRNKEKVATLSKEEGEWRIKAITDRH